MNLRTVTGSASSILLILSSIHVAVADLPLVSDSKCGCYVTNGSNSAFFTSHRFYDFRSLSQYVGSGIPDAPSSSPQAASNASITSGYFNTSAFTDDWSIMTWNNSASVGGDAAILMVNSPTNLFIQKNNDTDADSDTYLTMRTARNEDFQSASEIESNSNRYRFVSMRMLARTTGAPGACTALFTYRSAKDYADVQEADIEVLTKDPTDKIMYTNQPSYVKVGNDTQNIPESNINGTAPVDWTQWSVHRLDWTPLRTTWYVDGRQVASISFQTPRDASRINLNSWSDGGDWTGLMDVGKEARMQIKWLEMVFNQTSSGTSRMRPRDHTGNSGRGSGNGNSGGASDSGSTEGLSDGKCRTVCSIDDTDQRGMAAVVADGGAATLKLAAWIPISVALVTMAASMF
ncbi:hypothetical protein MGG_08823 [Pyricularia oryzae 70-15]|uniref:GH16 domain-containing protein n=3 Tax=Pyricularia oryzae TaxID=318829 RepID=G4MUQ9_PYRO7|nr:uncharacterized protein MGG_08823 [Pyricularia oryzae 70-15]EHA54032.1 hypothetical protein MGG_08823 [Pyricularia oryzae 70-15]ELQ42173.1 hypothetical protein OOU_Y34scaffold00228g64 [Pyricularia oryzae Y34]KAI7922669.1 hypothetical protein M9X92_004782 [Pyricularia oryzae]KAI7932460.1 hypothetical protein M0657_000590 [Pyricularia oryzae]